MAGVLWGVGVSIGLIDQNFLEPLLNNPIQWMAVAGVAAVATWAGYRYLHNEKLSVLEERIKLRDEKISDFQRQLAVSSPDEAAIKVSELEAKISELEAKVLASGPRKLADHQKNAMVSALAIAKGSRVAITKDGASPDAAKMSAGLSEVFTKAGWIVENPVVLGLASPPSTGISLNIYENSFGSVEAQAIINAFKAASIEFDQQMSRRESDSAPGTIAEILLTTPA